MSRQSTYRSQRSFQQGWRLQKSRESNKFHLNFSKDPKQAYIHFQFFQILKHYKVYYNVQAKGRRSRGLTAGFRPLCIAAESQAQAKWDQKQDLHRYCGVLADRSQSDQQQCFRARLFLQSRIRIIAPCFYTHPHQAFWLSGQ